MEGSDDPPPAYNPHYIDERHIQAALDADSSPQQSSHQTDPPSRTSATTSNSSAGNIVREKSISMAKSALQSAKKFDERHKVVQGSKNLASSAVQKTKELDENYHIREKTKMAAANVTKSAKEVNEKHHVTEKTKKVAGVAAKNVVSGVKFISKSVQQKKESSSGGDAGFRRSTDL